MAARRMLADGGFMLMLAARYVDIGRGSMSVEVKVGDEGNYSFLIAI